MLSALSPRSFADWPTSVTPPRFFRALLDAGQGALQELLVLEVRKDFLDHDMLGDAEVLGVVHHVVNPAQQPDHQRLDQVGVVLGHARKIPALDAREAKRVLYVVEDRVINALVDPLGEIPAEVLRQQQIPEPADLPVDEVHTLHLFEHRILVLGAERRPHRW